MPPLNKLFGNIEQISQPHIDNQSFFIKSNVLPHDSGIWTPHKKSDLRYKVPVGGIQLYVETPTAEVNPGTRSNEYLVRLFFGPLLLPGQKIKGSPPFSRTTVLPWRACSIKAVVIFFGGTCAPALLFPIDYLSILSSPTKNYRVNQRAMNNNISPSDAFLGAERNQTTISRPSTHQKPCPFFCGHEGKKLIWEILSLVAWFCNG